MAYNPEAVKAILGDEVSKLFDGTIIVTPSNGEMFGSLRIGDKLTFKFKEDDKPLAQAQFVIGK